MARELLDHFMTKILSTSLVIILLTAAVNSVLIGCDNQEKKLSPDGGKDRGGKEGGISDSGSFDGASNGLLDGGGNDSARADGGLIPDIEAGYGKDSTTPRDSGFPCCTCPLDPKSLVEYNDAGVNIYVQSYFGIHNNPEAKLYVLCFTKGVNCEDYKIEIRMIGQIIPAKYDGDTSNLIELPGMYFAYPKNETTDVNVDPYDSRWKIEITDAAIVYDKSYLCRGTVVPRLRLEGSISNVRFVRDETDSLANYVVLKDEQGNVVLDTRK